MKWPWWQRDVDRRARIRAQRTAEKALVEETARLDEAKELAAALAGHRQRNRFAEAMRIALGGK